MAEIDIFKRERDWVKRGEKALADIGHEPQKPPAAKPQPPAKPAPTKKARRKR
jgi:hypothetical protein